MNKDSQHKSQPLAKIDLKQMLAHPKDSIAKDVEYEKYDCIKCEVEYLSQGIQDYEKDFCPNHIDLRFCESCCEVFPKDEGKESEDGLWYCDEDFRYKCRNCKEDMNEDQTYCSKECHSEYMADFMEDDR